MRISTLLCLVPPLLSSTIAWDPSLSWISTPSEGHDLVFTSVNEPKSFLSQKPLPPSLPVFVRAPSHQNAQWPVEITISDLAKGEILLPAARAAIKEMVLNPPLELWGRGCQGNVLRLTSKIPTQAPPLTVPLWACFSDPPIFLDRVGLILPTSQYSYGNGMKKHIVPRTWKTVLTVRFSYSYHFLQGSSCSGDSHGRLCICRKLQLRIVYQCMSFNQQGNLSYFEKKLWVPKCLFRIRFWMMAYFNLRTVCKSSIY